MAFDCICPSRMGDIQECLLLDNRQNGGICREDPLGGNVSVQQDGLEKIAVSLIMSAQAFLVVMEECV